MLDKFPAEGVGGEILQPVREMIQDYETREARRAEVVKQLKALAARLKDTIAKENLKPILDEIAAEIGPDTLDRMAAFLQNADDQQTPDTEKLALAVSGWLLGADAATAEAPGRHFRLQGPRPDPRISRRTGPRRARAGRSATSRRSRAASWRRWPNCWPT